MVIFWNCCFFWMEIFCLGCFEHSKVLFDLKVQLLIRSQQLLDVGVALEIFFLMEFKVIEVYFVQCNVLSKYNSWLQAYFLDLASISEACKKDYMRLCLVKPWTVRSNLWECRDREVLVDWCPSNWWTFFCVSLEGDCTNSMQLDCVYCAWSFTAWSSSRNKAAFEDRLFVAADSPVFSFNHKWSAFSLGSKCCLKRQ